LQTDDKEMLLLLGKIYMLKKEYQKAFETFLKIGQTKETIPYLIELYYYKKDLEKVEELIQTHPELKFINKFHYIYRLWNE